MVCEDVFRLNKHRQYIARRKEQTQTKLHLFPQLENLRDHFCAVIMCHVSCAAFSGMFVCHAPCLPFHLALDNATRLMSGIALQAECFVIGCLRADRLAQCLALVLLDSQVLNEGINIILNDFLMDWH